MCHSLRVAASRAVFLGDRTNNVAEYNGILAALRHAHSIRQGRCIFRVDSKLVAQQLSGKWACREPALIPLYEEGIKIIALMKRASWYQDLQIDHIYREFNALADSLANVAIDRYDASLHQNGIVISEGWSS